MTRKTKSAGTRVLILAVLMIGLFQVYLFPKISSRIEGTVVDDVTGNPIPGVKAVIFDIMLVGLPCGKRMTNLEGKFIFDNLKESTYAMMIFKDGYAFEGDLLKLNIFKKESGGVTHFTFPESEKFHLTEGDIKHFNIRLKKEAVLKVEVWKKTPAKTELVNELVTMQLYVKEKRVCVWDFKNGSFVSSYLGEESYTVEFLLPLGNNQVYENVQLKTGETTELKHVIDCTVGTLVHGFALDKEKGYLLPNIDILATKVDEEFWVGTRADDKGEFWLLGLKPGKYMIKVDVTSWNFVNYETYFTVSENEKKEFNLIIPGGYK